jgi:hypothetical protein
MPSLAHLRAVVVELQAHGEGRLSPDHFVVWKPGGLTFTKRDGTVHTGTYPSYTAAFDRL